MCFLLGAVVFIFNLHHLSLNLPLCCLSMFSHTLPSLPSLSLPLLFFSFFFPLSGYTNFLLMIFCPLLMLLPCPGMLQCWPPAGTDAVGITSGLSPPCFYLILACSYPAGVLDLFTGGVTETLGVFFAYVTFSCPALPQSSPFSSWLCTDAVCSLQLQMCHIGFIHLLLLPSGKLLPGPLCVGTGHLQELGHVLGRVWWVPCHVLCYFPVCASPGHSQLPVSLCVGTEAAHGEE